MEYDIKPLSAELVRTFADYLGNLDFHHAPHWASCFCRYYYTDCSQEAWQGRTGEQNAAEAVRLIGEGGMHGYLAFDGETCVGWCCADDARAFLRLREEIGPMIEGKKVGCAICYVVRPEYRERGVARTLLRRAVADFRECGCDAVLALPAEIPDAPQKRYRGTPRMYEEMGFARIERRGPVSVMWLDLKS